ncbi:MAG: LysR family transcriptional regulator [Clostridia bacterium]|nr:LysR family transcriptional regulator [Clostridia bacterium]
MEMLQLRYFLSAAESGSFTATAKKYMVPQTSVSAAVKRLEAELGTKLFLRTSNKIVLNEKGKLLYQSVKEAFENLDATASTLRDESFDGRVITMLVCAIREQITDKIIQYKTCHPDIAFKTVFDFDATNLDDFYIIIDEKCDKYPMHECVELFTKKIKLYISKSNPLSQKKLVLSDLKNEPFISIGENNGLTKILINACKKSGFEPNFCIQSNDLDCTKRCVESGMGIGITRINQTVDDVSNVCYLDVEDFNETQTLCLYYKKSSAYGNVEHFINFLMNKEIAE